MSLPNVSQEQDVFYTKLLSVINQFSILKTLFKK